MLLIPPQNKAKLGTGNVMKMRPSFNKIKRQNTFNMGSPHYHSPLATKSQGQSKQKQLAGLCMACEQDRNSLPGDSSTLFQSREIYRMGTVAGASPDLHFAAQSYQAAGAQYLTTIWLAEQNICKELCQRSHLNQTFGLKDRF